MDITGKIIVALQASLTDPYVRLDNDDGISGFVVSTRFVGMPSIERQRLIDDALKRAPEPLSAKERQAILMIAGLTPKEYESVGARILVQQINERGDGSIEVSVVGSRQDAEYVRQILSKSLGANSTDPHENKTALGTLMTFTAGGKTPSRLTRMSATEALNATGYVRVLTAA